MPREHPDPEQASVASASKDAGCRCSVLILAVPRLGDAVEVEFPDAEIDLAGFDRGILHAVVGGEARHCLPARVGMLDVGRLMELEEIELFVAQAEELAPTL